MPFRNSCYDMNNLVHSLTAELNSNFGGKMSNQILGTYTKIADERGSDSSIFPMVDILKDGDMFMTAGYELYTYNNAVHNDIWTLTDNFTMNLDKHVITAGLAYEHQYVGNSFMSSGLGYYRYNSLEDFKTEQPPSCTRLPTATVAKTSLLPNFLSDSSLLTCRICGASLPI